MQESLAQMFNEIATAEHNASPKKLKNLVVFLFPYSETPVYVAPEIAKQLAKNTNAIRKAAKKIKKDMSNKKVSGIVYPRYFLKQHPIKVIMVNKKVASIFSAQYTEEMKATDGLTHEIGHLIVKNGLASLMLSRRHLAECSASAYSALRHIQIFGKKTDLFEYYGNNANAIVLGTSPIHYTAEVIQKIKQLSEKMDISALSLPETRKLAEKIAQENKLNRKTLKKIIKAFLPVKNAYEKTEGKRLDATVLQKCIEITLKYKDDPDIFITGKRYLNIPDVRKELENKAKTNPDLELILNFIENHQTNPVEKHKLTSRKQQIQVSLTAQQR